MPNIKAVTADLQASLGTSYDQTRTTLTGTAAQRTVLGASVVSPPPIKWLDVFTDAGETPFVMDYTLNGRIFVMTAIAGGLARVMYYTLDASTGATTYIGKVQLTFPNLAVTTHTIRGFKIDDTNPSNIRLFISTTATIAINGGAFMAYGLVLADFVPAGFPTLPMAMGSAQKAVYFLQDPSNYGSGQLNIASTAVALDRANSVAYVHNGISATHQVYLYDYSVTPNVPSTTVTITIAAPGVVTQAAHPYSAGDQIQFSTTGALPTGIVAGTTYFVKNPTANTYEFAATTGGASITTSGAQSGTQSSLRAFGITTGNWKWKTGNLTALSGVLLNNSSEKYMVPQHTVNSGSPCLFFATTTNLYIVKLSDLTNGQTAPPSLLTSNLLGAANQTVAPVAVQAYWNDALDHAIFTTSTTKIIAKKIINNAIEAIFGVLNNDYLEGVVGVGSTSLTQFGAVTVSDLKSNNGWTFILGGSTGQRGIIAKNSGADVALDATNVITKVLTLQPNSLLVGVAVAGQSPTSSSTSPIFYRTSGFGSAGGGWIAMPANNLFPPGTTASTIQFKVDFLMNDQLSSNPEFMTEMYLAFLPPTTMSDNWALDVDATTVGLASPSYVGFIMTQAYVPGPVPTLFLHGVDIAGSNVSGLGLNSVTNSSIVSYSTDGGSTWSALGTIPNTVGTKVRWNIASPPGSTAYVSMRES